MQRSSYAVRAALAATLLAAALTGCSGGSGKGSPDDSKAGRPAATTPAAQPGKYRSLPEPCGAVDHGTLRTLLPGLDGLDGKEREKAYEGQASITYDTDRRVGCRWKAESPEGTRHLSIDFQRVVSYDPAVSDADRAQELYDKKAADADIPTASPKDGSGSGAGDAGSKDATKDASGSPASPSASATGSAPDETDKGNTPDNGGAGKGDKGGKDGGPSGSGGPSSTADPGIAPRTLDGIADAAYLDDHLATADSGVHRDISVVFRASNVVVTIEYDQWSAHQSDLPRSDELQSNAQRLARELVGRFGS